MSLSYMHATYGRMYLTLRSANGNGHMSCVLLFITKLSKQKYSLVISFVKSGSNEIP